MRRQLGVYCGVSLMLTALAARAEIKVVTDHNVGDVATAGFRFANVPAPAVNDAGSKARVTIVEGRRDPNGGDVIRLNDGKVPGDEDQPSRNFFFAAGSDGGRIVLDLGGLVPVRQINTYSWHADTRAPQVYALYISDGSSGAFNAEPKRDVAPESAGWRPLAKVDTRPQNGAPGGQYGVTITNTDGLIGTFRYLLFAISRTEDRDAFGNTFFSEIDVIGANDTAETVPAAAATITRTFGTPDGRYRFTTDTTAAADLTEWAEKELAPVVQAWYPRIVELLPGEGFMAPTNITILFREGMGGTPASAAGSKVNCNVEWFRKNLKGEARGSVVHELVHVAQQYGRARRTNPNAARVPGWLVEGIPDYIRWFLYEPETKGAEITARNFARAKFDASYRITGNFLNWVTLQHDAKIVPKMNAAAREGRYTPELWKEYTGKTVQELGDEWRSGHQRRLGIPDVPAAAPERKE